MQHTITDTPARRSFRSRLVLFCEKVKAWILNFGRELVRTYAYVKAPEAIKRPIRPAFSSETGKLGKFHTALCFEAHWLCFSMCPGGRLLAWLNCLMVTAVAGFIALLAMFAILLLISVLAPFIVFLMKLVFSTLILLFAYLSVRAGFLLRRL